MAGLRYLEPIGVTQNDEKGRVRLLSRERVGRPNLHPARPPRTVDAKAERRSAGSLDVAMICSFRDRHVLSIRGMVSADGPQ